MKLKYLAYGFLGLAIVFAGVMIFLTYFSSTDEGSGTAGSGIPSFPGSGSPHALVRDQNRTVSGKAGKLIIAYAGDIVGSLGPCG